MRVMQEMGWMISNSKQISHFCVPTTRQVSVVVGLLQFYAKLMLTEHGFCIKLKETRHNGYTAVPTELAGVKLARAPNKR